MNKTAIKNYAIRARVQLIEAVKQRAYEYEITEDGENKSGIKTVGDRLLTPDEIKQREQLIDEIRHKGYNQVMEEAAYTWFNRFIALRFMEVNGFLPSRVRVFTDESGAFKPEILKEAMTVDIDGLDRNKVFDLLDRQENEELFKYLIITQCNALNQGLPYMFEKISNWTELLFPANLLRSDSVIGRMVSEIEEEDWQDAVQIIGWMYQYYNTELKDDTFARLKKNIKISKERIPAATQLFTPDWIVRYMVENSLGRLYINDQLLTFNGLSEGERIAEEKAIADKMGWKYYLTEAEQEPEVRKQLDSLTTDRFSLTGLKVIDPCMGSGHILVYAFDVLLQIYTACGWSERDAAKSILENNLYGLDIDDRAGQLAYFAIMMKARKHSRRILNGETRPNVLAIQDSGFMTEDFITYVAGKNQHIKADLTLLRSSLKDAKEYGSILNVPVLNYAELYERIDIISRSFAEDLFQAQYQTMAVELLLPLVKQAEIMAQKYDVVVTNPPYMGASGMSAKLSEFVKKNYPDSKSDLFAVFIERCGEMLNKSGYQAMITQHAWMFLSSYEQLRKKLLLHDTVNMAHLGARAFEEIGGEVVQTTSFVFRNAHIKDYKGTYCRLIDPVTQSGKEEMYLLGENRYISNQINYAKIPGMPFAYWVSDNFIKIFENGKPLSSYANVPKGLSTGSVDRFMRFWYEVEHSNINFSCADTKDTEHLVEKWYPYAKGGTFRRWNGNLEYVVNWQNNGFEVKNFVDDKGKQRSRPQNTAYYFKECMTYSAITSYKLSLRYLINCIFGGGGDSIHAINSNNFYYILGFVNSDLQTKILNLISPTMNFEVDHLKKLPLIIEQTKKVLVDEIVKENIEYSKKDWDTFETSWNFKKHPLVPYAPITDKIELAYEYWEKKSLERFVQLKANEEELNRIFIDIYGLQDELTPEVEEKDVTVRKADLQREIKSLISYAIGCIFGRYSLDVEGLAFAGGEWDESKYKTVIPDADNILPICDDDYFEDDLANKIFKWVETVYGKETLEENLRFIADALGGKGTAREVIRNYLLNGFYADHLKIYQKRPIYWLFSSGKKNGFKALIYMHRYQPDLLARMRTDYVHEQQERYRTQLSMLEESIASASPSEKVKLNKSIAKLKDQALEISQYEEKIHHLADQMISIDLDDGVKVNYAKFQDVLEKIK